MQSMLHLSVLKILYKSCMFQFEKTGMINFTQISIIK